jgi:hypothetical protein
MPTLKLPAVMVHSSQHYRAQLNGQVRVGEVARYLAQYESRIESSTLEIARPVGVNQRLQDIDVHPGDRLVVFTGSPHPADLPAPLRPGDKMLKFRLGDFEAHSRGKKALLVGKADENQQTIPDIDLRFFVPPRGLEFISRQCLTLTFDERTRAWQALKTGQTRITLDELELGPNPVSLNDDQWLRFYRAMDDPRSGRPIGEIRLTVEPVQTQEVSAPLPQGSYPLEVRIGLEKESQMLKASENIRLGQVISSLVAHNRMALNGELHAYLMRLASPDARLQDLNLVADEFLYAAFSLRYARNALLLRDVQNANQVYILTAGQGDDEKVIGCRPQPDAQNIGLDVDLFDTITAGGHDPRPFPGISPYYARILYQSADSSWWVRLEERAHVPLFVNNLRAGSRSPIQLTSGDVLSFGPSVEQYYARLAVEITKQDGVKSAEF